MHPAIGVMFPCREAPETLPAAARLAEEVGLDELWVVEDCFFSGGISAAAIALASTQRVRVGLGIVPAVVRNAAFTAMEFATLARVYPDRFVAGIGHGMPDWIRQVGEQPVSPLTALDEVLVAVRALLDGQEVTASGSYVELDAVKLAAPPVPAPPVLAGVRGPRSLALAGRSADGIILAEPTSPEYVRWARGQAGLDGQGGAGQFPVVAYAWMSVAGQRDQAEDRLRAVMGPVLATPDIRAHLAALGMADDVAALVTAQREGVVDGSALPSAWIRQLAVAGTPEDCAARIKELAAAGADRVVLIPQLGHFREQVSQLSQSVLPLLT